MNDPAPPPTAARPPLRRRLAFGLAPPLALLALGEAAVRVLDPGPPPALLASPLGHAFDQKTPRFYRDHPRLFWELRPNLDEPLSRHGDRTDALGLRNDRTPGPKDPARRRIACLGDSCTYGMGVALPDAWPAQLARRSGWDVVNAGVPGYSSWQGRALWDDRVGALDPDAVVVEFGINDVAPWPTPDGDTWAFLTDRERAPHAAFAARPFGSALVGWIAGRVTVRAPVRLPRDGPPEGLARATARVPPDEFREIVADLARRAPAAVIVAWPYRTRLEQSPEQADAADPLAHPGMTRMAAYREILRDVAAQGGHAFVDVETLFRDSGLPPQALFVDDVHGTPAALGLVADAVGRALR